MAEDIDRFSTALQRGPDPARRLLRLAPRGGACGGDGRSRRGRRGGGLEPDAIRRLGSHRLDRRSRPGCSARRLRRRPARAPCAGAPAAPAGSPSRRRPARARVLRATSSAPVAAIRSQTSSAQRRRCVIARRSTAASSPSRARARISGSVTVPSSRSAPRGLPVRSGGPRMSRTSSSIWNATPIRSPNAPSDLGTGSPRQRAELARRAEQDRGLQPAALEIALDGDVARPRVVALHQLAGGELRARAREDAGPRRPSRAAASSANARENSRSPVAVARRPAAGGDDGRPAAPQRRAVEHVVVDERRAVHELDGDRRAHHLIASRASARPPRGTRAADAAACRPPRSSRPRSGRAPRRGRPRARPSAPRPAPSRGRPRRRRRRRPPGPRRRSRCEPRRRGAR